MLVASSCPGCLGRRMSDTAVHLTASVLPEVAVQRTDGALLGHAARKLIECVADLIDKPYRQICVSAARQLNHAIAHELGRVVPALQGLYGAGRRGTLGARRGGDLCAAAGVRGGASQARR